MKTKILSIAVLALGIPLCAQTRIHVKDSDSSGNLIPAEIYGQFSEHLGTCIYGGIWVGPDSDIPNTKGYRTDVLEALRALDIPVLRWPGGCFADDYHWMDGIGPREKRARISNNNWGDILEDNSFGTHEFLDFCELIGCQPYISGNVGSGSVEELAKWVEYMTSDAQSMVADMRRENGRDKPWDVKYLGIGNEAWGCGGNMTPEYYSNLFRRYSTYTRNYNRNHPLYEIASGASDTDYAWTEVCMKNIGTRMDAIAVHYYTVPGGWGEGRMNPAASFTDEDYYRTIACAVGIDDCIRKHIAIMDKYDPQGRVDLVVDEWGTWWASEPDASQLYQQNTMRDALVAALSLNIFHKHTGRLKMCNIAQVVNVLQSMVLTSGADMVLTPTWYVFELYKPHQNARFVPVDYPQEELCSTDKGDVPGLSVTASCKEGTLTVSLVNPSLDKDRDVLLDWDTMGGGTDVSARILTAERIKDFNDFGKTPSVSTKDFRKFRRTSEGIRFTLSAKAVVSFTIR